MSPISGIAAGLLAGSFIATLVVRWPSGESALVGRSRCDHCGTAVPVAGLVPLLSYAVQRGKSRCCGARIDPVHPFAELASAAVGGLSALLPWPQAIASAWLGWTLLALALIDLLTLRLPNAIVALLAVTGVAASLLLGVTPLADSLIGAAAGFASLEAVRLLYRAARGREGIGRGDPKMFAAIGAWIGWAQLPLALLIASLAGLVAAAGLRTAGRRMSWSDMMPLGTLLALAGWPLWLWTAATAAAR